MFHDSGTKILLLLIDKNFMQKFIFFGLFIIAVGCAPKVTTTGTSNNAGGKYTEDLSVWRPKDVVTDTIKKANTIKPDGTKSQSHYVEAKFTVNNALDAVLDSISEVNLANGTTDGFTIQVYSGIKREEALNAKKELSSALPDLDAEVQYVQPNFRVRAGKYYDRLQAQRDYLAIKRYFPNAIVIPDRIPIN